MSDLIERLRAVEHGPTRRPGVTTNWHRNPDGPEAADEIERLHNKLNQDSQNFQIECHKEEAELLRRELAEARGLLERCVPRIDRGMTSLHAAIAAFLAKGDKPNE